MRQLEINIHPQFCSKCGTKCYLSFKEDGYMDDEMTYKVTKTCPHSNIFNAHDEGVFVDYAERGY